MVLLVRLGHASKTERGKCRVVRDGNDKRLERKEGVRWQACCRA